MRLIRSTWLIGAVLTAVLVPGASRAVAQDVDDAIAIEVDLPETLSCGQDYEGSVTMYNAGTTTWTEDEEYRLGAVDDSDDLSGPGRVFLPDGLSIHPGESYTFAIPLTAPTTAGWYRTDWRMLRERIAWFGQTVTRYVQVECQPPGVDDAMVIAADLPSTLSCGQSYSASVTMRNTGSTTWTEGEAIRLGAVGNTDDLGGPGRIHLPGGLSVSPNETHTFPMMLTAPMTPGTYVTDWRMLRERVAWFGQVAAQTVEVGCEPAYNGSRIVSVSTPDVMAPGTTADVSITVENTGSTTWEPSTYSLGAVDDALTWGLNRVPLDAPVEPGDQKVFTFTITAPSTIGSYDFDWRMVQEYVEWFGESTAGHSIFVWSGLNSAAFVSQSGVPANMVAGQSATVSVTMENIGTTVWDSTAGYFLGSINPYNNQVWGLARVPLDHPVQPLDRATFTFTITAPSTPGPHVFQWQMLRELVEWFGTPTPSSVIVVGSPNDMAIPLGHTIPETVTSGTLYYITVTMQNTGTSTWSRDGDGPPDGSEGYKLAVKSGTLLPVGRRIPMTFGDEAEPGEAYTFYTTLVPPDGLSFASVEFQMIHEGWGWFGESLHVGVAIDGARGDCRLILDPPNGPPGTTVTATPATCTFEASSQLLFSFGDPDQHAYSLVPVKHSWLGPTRIMFTVPSDAGCGSHYARVRMRRLERRPRGQTTLPAEFNVTGPCDPSRRNSFDVLSYNVHLLPILDDSDGYRAGLIASHPDLRGHDAVVFVEAMDDNRWVLITGLRQDYPYITPVITDDAKEENGGVFIMSKWPIDVHSQWVFQHCHGDLPTNPPDCRAAKGVNLARINKAGQPYLLLGTHFDAGLESGDFFARQLQTDEMAALHSLGAPAEQPVIMAGDFNIDKISLDPARRAEYAYLQETLRVTAPSDPPYPPYQGTNPKGEWIDYVFYSNAHLVPRESYNYVIKPRDAGGGDLSDHYAVLGRFRFVPPGATRRQSEASAREVTRPGR